MHIKEYVGFTREHFMGKKQNGNWFTVPAEETTAKVRCPKCSAGMAPEAVLCMACGFNQVSQKYVELPRGSAGKTSLKKRKTSIFKTLSLLILAIIVAGGIYIYLNYEGILLKHRHLLPHSLADKLPKQLDRPFNSLWLNELKNKSVNRAYQGLVKAELKTNHPFFTYDELVTLELLNGNLRTGQFKTANETAVLLQIDAEIVAIPFSTLKTKSRVRCDRAERGEFVDKIAQDRTRTFLTGEPQNKREP
jgi:ribosomal protein L40E